MSLFFQKYMPIWALDMNLDLKEHKAGIMSYKSE
jgi:hypothetical protein